jgi:hypothetical protein
MNWPNVLTLAAGMLIVFFALLRVERRRLWVVLVVLLAPSLFLTAVWASWRNAWPEALVAVGIAGAVAGGWWLAIGRRLPRPTSDSIKVWGQESLPQPRPAELQAELNRLKEEKARLEAELRRLKGDGQRGEG